MINDNTILSSFDDRPTLLEWLKKVEDALKSDTATAVSVENPSANTYVFKITFADGTTLSSGNVVFPNAVQDVSIKNGHIIVTQISGTQTDLGVLNPYADTIVENAETNTTEIGNNVEVGGDLSVQGSVVGRGIVTSIGRLTANGGIEVHGQGYVNGTLGVTGNATIGGRLQADSSIISNGEIRGGNISGTKFLLGTEEMPLVKANPTGEATQTLEKVKIGDVAYNVGGGGGGINRKNLYLQISRDFTDVTTPDGNLKYQFTQAGNAKLDEFINGINHDNVISLYCEQIVINGGGQVPDNSTINTMYGTFDIPGNLYNELAMSLTFLYESGNFAFFKDGEQWYYGFTGSQKPDFIINPTGLELFIYYL